MSHPRRLRTLWQHLLRFGSRRRAPLSFGNMVRLMDDGALWMEELERRIREARHQVDFEIYIWSDDPTGRRILEALKAVRGRGLRVRGLVDAVGSWGSQTLLDEARAFGLEILLYHPINLRLPWRSWHRRNHRKLLITDDVAMVGSANWGSEYDCTLNGGCYRDLGLMLRGPVVSNLQMDFERAWRHAGGRSPRTSIEKTEGEPELGPEWFLDVSIQVVSSFSSGIRATRRHLVLVLGQVRRRLIIANAYFVPDPQLKHLMERIARRGVQVDVLLPGHTDHRFVQAASRHVYPDLLRAGVRIRERRERLLHAKAAVLDGEIAMIGTANLDMRSFRYNRELNLVLRDPALVSALERVLIQDLASSDPIEWQVLNSWGWLQRQHQRLAYAFWPWL